MKTFVSYVTGCIALTAMVAAVFLTVAYLMTNPEAGSKLASSMVSGIGTAMGACVGAALILRFKAARRFLRQLFYEKDD